MGNIPVLPVFDGHTDVPTKLWSDPDPDLGKTVPGRDVSTPRLVRGGVGAVVFALYGPGRLGVDEGLEHALDLHRATVPHLRSSQLVPVLGPDACEAAMEDGRTGVLLGLENGRPLLRPEALPRVLELGVRIVTLCHSATHEWCDAAGDEPTHGGLSSRGEEIVRSLNDRCVLVDVSHVSDLAVEHALEVSRAPVVASHSSARALCDHPRNLPDRLIRKIAGAGGLVMVNAFPGFLAEGARRANEDRLERLWPLLESLREAYAKHPELLVEARERLFAAHPLPPVPIDRYVDHLLHVVEVAGEEHVGIGSDFDGISETPRGFEHHGRLPRLFELLGERGMGAEDLRLLAWDNAIRVWRLTEAAGRG